MMSEYIGIAVCFVVAGGIAGAMVVLASTLGKKRPSAVKSEPFECGESQIVSPYQRFSVKFYLVAVLFILFDIEVVFLFPWAILYKKLGLFGLIEMLIFLLILGVGLMYVWIRGGLDWE